VSKKILDVDEVFCLVTEHRCSPRAQSMKADLPDGNSVVFWQSVKHVDEFSSDIENAGVAVFLMFVEHEDRNMKETGV